MMTEYHFFHLVNTTELCVKFFLHLKGYHLMLFYSELGSRVPKLGHQQVLLQLFFLHLQTVIYD